VSGRHVQVAVAGGLARLTLDRPPVNVLTTEVMVELAEALREAAAREDVRVVRLDARGKHFCAGVDVGDHEGPRLGPMMAALPELFLALERTPQPLVAVAKGACLGGGLELLLGCDLVVASETATFGQPEIKLGVFAPPASVLLPRLVGPRIARGMLLTGEPISAAQASAWGLVHAVAPVDALDETADAFVERLLALSGAALRHAKRAIAAACDLPLRDAHERVHRIYLEELMTTADAAEGLRAFVEKRPPVWTHR
jgi:cyclohexa-1,5-dienecarbonyl-CoA hydratase